MDELRQLQLVQPFIWFRGYTVNVKITSNILTYNSYCHLYQLGMSITGDGKPKTTSFFRWVEPLHNKNYKIQNTVINNIPLSIKMSSNLGRNAIPNGFFIAETLGCSFSCTRSISIFVKTWKSHHSSINYSLLNTFIL